MSRVYSHIGEEERQVIQIQVGNGATVRAIAAIQENYGNPSAIVMDPKSWAVLGKLKYKDGVLQLGSPVASAARTLFSLPVYITPSMTAGNALIVSKADLIAAVGTIDLTTSAEAAFSADSLVHRITWRIGWNTVHANRFAKLAITLPTQTLPTQG